jgi:hypothetical protein
MHLADLREEYSFSRSCSLVKCFVGSMRQSYLEVADVLEHRAGEEAPVDFFQRSPTLDPERVSGDAPRYFRWSCPARAIVMKSPCAGRAVSRSCGPMRMPS